jgi:hypothetical protein
MLTDASVVPSGLNAAHHSAGNTFTCGVSVNIPRGCYRQNAPPIFDNKKVRSKNDRTINDATPVYRFSSLIVSTMLSLRIVAPETIMVAKTIARVPAMQARIAPQGRLKAKLLTPPNWR